MTLLAGQTATGLADGIGSHAQFWYPSALAVDPTTGNIFVIDNACIIRKILLSGSCSDSFDICRHIR